MEEEEASLLLERRAALLGGAGAVMTTTLLLLRAEMASAAEEAPSEPSFFERWPYREAGDFVPFLEANAAQGDAAGVLAALDRWGEYYPAYKLTPTKAAFLASMVTR